MGDVNNLFVFKCLLTMPSNVLPLHLKQTFSPIIWMFTEGESDGIQSRLPFKTFSTLIASKIFFFTQFIHIFQKLPRWSLQLMKVALKAHLGDNFVYPWRLPQGHQPSCPTEKQTKITSIIDWTEFLTQWFDRKTCLTCNFT